MRARALSVIGALTSVAVGAGLVTGTTVAPAQAVTTDQSYWVPVSKQVVVRGHGYAHGHGMTQYGAQGAALQGRTSPQIVGFYYPGTTLGRMRGKVRVLISADTTSDVVVSPEPGLSLRDLATGRTYVLPDLDGVTRWRINVDHGRSVVGYLTGRWHRWKVGGAATLGGDAEFFGDGPLTLWTPYGPKEYRGSLRSATPSPGATYRDTVNVLPMDAYVQGVVPFEMPASWSPEAVKAQAVAARTYATWSRNSNRSRYYQICDTTSCQVYGGVGGEDPRSNRAVRQTRRQILRYQGRPAFTQFSSSSGGWTAAGSMPYLPAKEDPFDGWSGNPVHDWTVTIDAGRLERTYPAVGTLRRILVEDRDGHGEWEGRVNSVVLDGTRGNVTISGDDFRWMFGLRSDWFTIDPTPIIARWTKLGGPSSRLGGVRTKEYAAGAGSAQVFDGGRIFYSRRTGAHELYGPILAAYRRTGGPDARLGMPRTTVQPVAGGFRALFQHGAVFVRPGAGAVPVAGRIARRYLRFGGVTSELGWPTATNFAIARGERVDFQHGYIRWIERTGRTRLTVTG
jgi:SpoIID/LytB domain protein